MTEHFFEPRGIYYRINSIEPSRKTLVFVHGLSGSSSAWLPYEKDLEATYNILSFDLRGHGKSEKPNSYEAYKIEQYADDFFELVRFLGIRDFVIVGHSLGSLVVLAFLKEHQDIVSGVVLLSPHFSVKGMISAKILRPILAVVIPLLQIIPGQLKRGGHVDYTRFPNTGDWNIPRMIADIGNTSLRVYVYATRQTYDFDGGSILGLIKPNTLIVHGDRDTVFPYKYGRIMADAIPNATFTLLPGVDHIVALNNSKEVVEIIKNFVV